MQITAEHLLRFKIRDVRQTVTRRDCAFYALSVGFGQNPADTREHRFVDPSPDMAVVPSMALVVGYPGFWLGEPDTGVDAAKVAHVGQEIRLHAPILPDTAIVGQTRVTGLYRRPGGKGLAMTSVREIVAEDSGEPLASVEQTHFLLGDDSTDDLPEYRSAGLRIEGTPDIVFEQETRPEQALLYRLNGDMNPLHIDPAVAASAGFLQPILHGMCSFGIATRAMLATLTAFDAGSVRRIAMSFRAPVYPGETLSTAIWRDGRFRVRVLQRDVVVIDGGRVEFEPGAGVRSDAGVNAPVASSSIAEKA